MKLPVVPTIETPLAFLEEVVEALPGDPVVPSQVALRLVPEVLDTIDVTFVSLSFGKSLTAVYTPVVKR